MSKFLLLLWKKKKKKNDRNLKTHVIRTTTLPTPKFRPTSIIWTHDTRPKVSTLVTHAFFLTHAKILWTHAPTLSIDPRYPRHPRYLADSFLCNDNNFCQKIYDAMLILFLYYQIR